MFPTASLPVLLVATVLAASVFGLLALVGAILTRPLWAHAAYLAPAYGLLPVGLTGTVVFFAWLVDPLAGRVCGALALLLALVVVVRGVPRLHGQGLLAGLSSPATRLVAVALGLLLLSLGLLLLWGGHFDLFWHARERFSHPLPNDNELPSIIATRLLEGSDPRVPIGGWLSSDRPPLQTGLLLLVLGETAWTPIPLITQSFAASVACQMCWMPAVYALSRALRFSPRGSLGAVAFAGLSGTVLLNTVFTWPKLLSAGFVVAALAVALDLYGRRSRGRSVTVTVAVAALAAFGLLSHGAAVFALPVLAVVLWWARRSLSVTGLVAGGFVAFVLYAPWLAYQRWYDPPGDRLLKWHLAGVIEIDDRPFLDALLTAYRNLPFRTWLEYKLANLKVPVGVLTPSDVEARGLLPALRAEQFYSMLGALSLAVLPLLLVLATAARQRWRERSGSTPTTQTAGLLVACGAAVLLWCLVLFGPATTWVHSGSHVPIVLGTCLPMAWLIDRSVAWAGVLGVAQLGVLALLYLRPNYPGELSWQAVVTLMAAAALLLWALTGATQAGSATRNDCLPSKRQTSGILR